MAALRVSGASPLRITAGAKIMSIAQEAPRSTRLSEGSF
jgi:hypothetical protein